MNLRLRTLFGQVGLLSANDLGTAAGEIRVEANACVRATE